MGRWTRAALALAIVGTACPARPAAAWECLTGSCPTWCDEAVYALSTASSDLGEATTVAEVQRGMDDWSLVACTSLQTRYTGRTDATAGVSGDGVSAIGWFESSWRHSSNAIGVAGPRWGFDGCIREADMEMNGVHFTWTTDPGRGSRVNAYSIILHEGGHYLGLGHSSVSAAAMYFAYGGGILSLHEDDVDGICTLYPGEGDPDPECTHDDHCGSGEVCNTSTGKCEPEPPTGCTGDGDCGPGEVCDTSMGACKAEPPTGCTGDGDCGPGEVCDTSTGACHGAPGGDTPLGEACETSSDCDSGLCAITAMGSVCSEVCDPFASSPCPGGFYCATDALGACDAGLCLAGLPGPGALGDPCTLDTECASLVCADFVCTELCVPGSGSGCPGGYQCQPGARLDCGACREETDTGAPCTLDEDCEGGVCLEPEDGGDPYCTAPCAGDRDCPYGFQCRMFGTVSVCEVADDVWVPGDAGTDGVPARIETLEGDCGCAVPGGTPTASPALAGVLIVLVVASRRRRRRR